MTSTAAPTKTYRDNFDLAAAQFGPVLEALRGILEVELPAIEAELEGLGSPWTPGRLPNWTRP